MTKEEALAILRSTDLRTLSVHQLDDLLFPATDEEYEVWEDPEYPVWRWRIGEQDKDEWESREFNSERSAMIALARHLLEQ